MKPIKLAIASLQLSEDERDEITAQRTRQFNELADRIGYANAAFRMGFTPGDRVVYRAKSDRFVMRPLKGAGADITLMDRDLISRSKVLLSNASKAFRLQHMLINNRERIGSNANLARAAKTKEQVINLYKLSKLPPHNRMAQIAGKLGISRQRVGQILKEVGIKK